MRCIVCGTLLEENAEFCSECRAKQNINSDTTETKEKTETNSEPKICPVCGETMAADARFCPRCGKAMNGQPDATNIIYAAQIVPANTVHYSGMAIAGFILSFFFPILGLIFSCIGLNQCTSHGKRGKGLAVAGLVLNVLWFLYLIGLCISSCINA